jgi:ornithine cyclodeaminase
MAAAIEAMLAAFGDDREVPARVQVGPSLFMPGRVGEETGIKVVSTVPGDPCGIVVVFDRAGRPLGLVDGPTLTAIRTGAGAGLATRLLAQPEARTMAMLGCGSMAADQVDAVRAVRGIEHVWVWSRDRARAGAFAERIGGEAVDDPGAAISRADVVTTATPAREPLFADGAVQPGTHINAIGSFTPQMAEVPPDTVNRAFVVVDELSAAAREAGDLIQAGRQPDATLGDLLAGRISPPGTGLTLFKSVGIASQDVAAAAVALARAEELGIGVEIDL